MVIPGTGVLVYAAHSATILLASMSFRVRCGFGRRGFGVETLDEELGVSDSDGSLNGLSEPLCIVAEMGGEMSIFLLLGLYLGGGV